METISVYAHELLDLLKKAKSQSILLKVYNHSEKWSEHFFRILEIKGIRDKDYSVTIIILFDSETSESTAIDVKTISGVEFNIALEHGGKKYQKISILK
jgi:hypothetical protein